MQDTKNKPNVAASPIQLVPARSKFDQEIHNLIFSLVLSVQKNNPAEIMSYADDVRRAMVSAAQTNQIFNCISCEKHPGPDRAGVSFPAAMVWLLAGKKITRKKHMQPFNLDCGSYEFSREDLGATDWMVVE